MPDELPKVEKELVQSRRDFADLTSKLTDSEKERQELLKQIGELRQENELFRKALLEIEVEKTTIAYNQLGSSLKIRMLLQDQPAV